MADLKVFTNQTANGYSEEFPTNELTTIVASGTFDGATLKLQVQQNSLSFDWADTGDTLTDTHTSDYLRGSRRFNFRFELIDAGAGTDLTVVVGG